jgi:hypothetical protein
MPFKQVISRVLPSLPGPLKSHWVRFTIGSKARPGPALRPMGKGDLIKSITSHLDDNATMLRNNPRFSGLYSTRSRGQRQIHPVHDENEPPPQLHLYTHPGPSTAPISAHPFPVDFTPFGDHSFMAPQLSIAGHSHTTHTTLAFTSNN